MLITRTFQVLILPGLFSEKTRASKTRSGCFDSRHVQCLMYDLSNKKRLEADPNKPVQIPDFIT